MSDFGRAVAASMTRFIYMAKAICSSVAACPERIDVDNSVDSLDANVDEDRKSSKQRKLV